MFALWMADVLRAAGLSVAEVPGWQTRTARYEDGSPRPFHPKGLIVHETQGSLTSSDAGEINVMINGRTGLAGPIAHLYLSRTGTWHVVNAGASNHVRDGWGGIFAGLGNDDLLGIEAQHAKGEPWTQVQYRSYVRGVAAILHHAGWRVEGHKHHQPGDKSDPGFDMDRFRADVAAQTGDELMATASEQITWEIRPWTAATLHAVGRIEALVSEIAKRVDMSPEELEAIKAAAETGAREGIAQTLTPETIAAAIPDDIAADVVDLLAARLARPVS